MSDSLKETNTASIQYILRTNKEQLLYFPAAVKLHHATRGGLLHHSWTILQMAKSVVSIYPLLNPDLLYAGAILHDIGKLEELQTNSFGLASAYTAEGQLLGHISIGVSVIAILDFGFVPAKDFFRFTIGFCLCLFNTGRFWATTGYVGGF